MRVEPSGLTPLSQPTSKTTTQAVAKPAGGGSIQAPGSFKPTTELANLLNLVRKTPDVRPEVVQEGIAKAASGELETEAAAADSAAAFLASSDDAASG